MLVTKNTTIQKLLYKKINHASSNKLNYIMYNFWFNNVFVNFEMNIDKRLINA